MAGFHHVEMWVADLDEARAEWGWLLHEVGFERVSVWDEGESWEAGGAYLTLTTSPNLTGARHDRRAAGVNHLAFAAGSAERVDAVMAAASAHGWRPLYQDRYPHAGGPSHYAGWLENSAGVKAEVVADPRPAAPPTRDAGEITDAYSMRAAEYAESLGTMDAVHPADRHLVEEWARGLDGPILDAGCGPGHWTAHLAGMGADVRGIDLTPAFLDHARARHPHVRFDVESLDALSAYDDSLGGILSWFSTIHHDPARLPGALDEFARTLRPGGGLLLGFFDGDAVEPFEHAVVSAYRWTPFALHAALEDAGFDVIETHRRTEQGRRPVGAVLARRRAHRAG